MSIPSGPARCLWPRASLCLAACLAGGQARLARVTRPHFVTERFVVISAVSRWLLPALSLRLRAWTPLFIIANYSNPSLNICRT
ncbi:jg22803 [Pararge aegeria aegeria]|uniref:Jg22803 protein n=1 Tax=Pararge aegeria aegeria TaxID=348720 RepID=A0A8S4RY52_9NEOP|nr:jg22803 [Pararge aegeria aegeria]